MIPGPSLIVIGAFIHGVFTGFAPFNITKILIITALAVIAWGGQYFMAAVGLKSFGGSKYGMIGATAGLVAGLITPIPGGIIVGAFLGAIFAEIIFGYKKLKAAFTAGIGAVLGLFFSFFFELAVALVMVWYTLMTLISQ